MSSAREKINDLKVQLNRLDVARKELSAEIEAIENELTDDVVLQYMAETLHALLYRSNHIDLCDWDYSTWDNPGYSRKRYYKMATAIMDERYTSEDVDCIFSCIVNPNPNI